MMEPSAVDRQEVGRWLAGLYLREVDRPALDLYRSGDGERLLDQLAAFPPLRPLLEALRATVLADVDPETIRLDLAAAYGRLFLTGGPHSVPLHASAYLSERGLLMQGPAQETAAVLDRLGLSCPPDFREPLDHMGIQLSILAELAGADGSDDLTEAGYLGGYLLPWVPTMAALCARLSTVPLYRELGPSTLGWLRALERQLGLDTPGA